MNLEELKAFLPTLSISALKDICNIPRQWGVYRSYPAITGYSKHKTKKDLVGHIINHFSYYTKKHYCDNECPNYFGYVQKELDFVYQGGIIKMETIKIHYLGDD
jgi:hypothetical protein